MLKRDHRKTLFHVLCAAIALLTSAAWAEDHVVAVLSGNSAPYIEAYNGFQENNGAPAETYRLWENDTVRPPSHTQLVVTFGGTAAHKSYPADAGLLYCMAPGTLIESSDRGAPSVGISMIANPQRILVQLREIQPSLAHLAILWSSPAFSVVVQQMRQEAGPLGIQITAERLTNAARLPDRLRELKGKVDALWLPPDPDLVNEANFVSVRQFALSERIPFYTATSGLVDMGATASVSTSFRDIGRATAQAARRMLAGEHLPSEIYPEPSELVINLTAARNDGLQVSPATLKKATKVVP